MKGLKPTERLCQLRLQSPNISQNHNLTFLYMWPNQCLHRTGIPCSTPDPGAHSLGQQAIPRASALGAATSRARIPKPIMLSVGGGELALTVTVQMNFGAWSGGHASHTTRPRPTWLSEPLLRLWEWDSLKHRAAQYAARPRPAARDGGRRLPPARLDDSPLTRLLPRRKTH